jgi:hypothetical protein
MVPSDVRKLRLDLAGCLHARVVGAVTLPFAVPRLRSLVQDNVHRYDVIHSESVHARFVKISTVMDALVRLGSRLGLGLMFMLS